MKRGNRHLDAASGGNPKNARLATENHATLATTGALVPTLRASEVWKRSFSGLRRDKRLLLEYHSPWRLQEKKLKIHRINKTAFTKSKTRFSTGIENWQGRVLQGTEKKLEIPSRCT